MCLTDVWNLGSAGGCIDLLRRFDLIVLDFYSCLCLLDRLL
jgi:hypothetical protein